ncbi:MAG: hypothetical protein ACRDHS_14320 [Actinomycetota bacterium]
MSHGLDPPRHDVLVRGTPKVQLKHRHEIRWRRVKDPPGLGQGHGLEAVLIEEVREIARDLVIGALDARRVHFMGNLLSVVPRSA